MDATVGLVAATVVGTLGVEAAVIALRVGWWRQWCEHRTADKADG
jgi:hypothetical protein